jgi:hypothetical protein
VAESPPPPLPPGSLPLWRRALSRWGYGVDLGLPEPLPDGDDVAYIDLRTRRTRINVARLARLGLLDRLEALFAHEAGHHCRWPQTLVGNAKLLRRQAALLTELETARPGGRRIGRRFQARRYDFLQNLLLDVLINDELRDVHGHDFVALYRALAGAARAAPSRVFSFTLALYEALWELPAETLVSPDAARRLAAVSATYREEAATLATALREHTPNAFTCLDLYLEAVWAYLVTDEDERELARAGWLEAPFGSQADELDPDVLVETVRRSREERDADRERERRRHPVLVELPEPEPEDGADPRGAGTDELERILRAGTGFGAEPGRLVEAILWYYEREAERLRLRLEQVPANEPTLPTTLAPWEAGDEPSGIDWTASLGRAGVAIPGLTLLQREFEADPAGGRVVAPPWLELYIDSSGSMSDPSKRWSDLAFAGFLLVRAALAAGSRVRVVQFSGPGHVRALEDFTAELRIADRALLEYFGGGTQFPFEELAASLARWRSAGGIERVVLTDLDFVLNVQHAQDVAAVRSTLTAAATPPSRLTAILNVGRTTRDELRAMLPPGLRGTGVRLLPIADWQQLHGVAAALGRAFFDRPAAR